MKPGPAISTAAMSGWPAMRAATISATARGFMPGGLRAAQRDRRRPVAVGDVARALERRIGHLGERELARVHGGPNGVGDELGDGVSHGDLAFRDAGR